MPPAVAAAGITVGGSLLGSLLNRPSAADKSLQAAQTGNLNSQTQLADLLGKMGKDQLALTGPAYKRAQDYYTSLLGGDIAGARQQTGAERSQISDLYSGATSRINRTLTGPARDQAVADMLRAQTDKLAQLVPNARKDAAAALYAGADPARVASLFSAAGGAYGGANSAAGNLFQDEQTRRANSMSNGASFAKLLGSVDWTSLFGGSGKKAPAGSGGSGTFYNVKPISFGYR
jgi:hypothetical protein